LSPLPFSLVIFGIVSPFLPRPAWSFLHSWDGSQAPPHSANSLTFCPGWPPTGLLSISATWVVRITGMSHHTWLLLSL
jgi:hypothetical protein